MTAEVATPRGGTSIPLVDFAEFGSHDPVQRSATAAVFRGALEAVGFCYLRNHGVPASLVDTVFAQSEAFFALPQAAKEAVRPSAPASTLGYGGVGSQALEKGRPGDLKEIFQARPGVARDEENAWPPQLPAFQEAVVTFHAAAVASCTRLMAAIAVSLELPEDYFVPFFERSHATIRLLHHPPLPAALVPGQIRAGAHTDFGGLSLLFPGEEGGLEIQAPDGTWLPAPALPGAAIVNTGDLIERWTNGMFRSTLHRVANPVGPAVARDRYSVVLFHGPSADAVITCLEPCQSPERPPRYEPITAGEHVAAKARASRGEA
jgi:isopenicillin N synthase-like dioxygenase